MLGGTLLLLMLHVDLFPAEEEEDEEEAKTKKETQWGWELLNDNKAIWLRSAGDVDEDEYNKFYQALTKVCRGAGKTCYL